MEEALRIVFHMHMWFAKTNFSKKHSFINNVLNSAGMSLCWESERQHSTQHSASPCHLCFIETKCSSVDKGRQIKGTFRFADKRFMYERA